MEIYGHVCFAGSHGSNDYLKYAGPKTVEDPM